MAYHMEYTFRIVPASGVGHIFSPPDGFGWPSLSQATALCRAGVRFFEQCDIDCKGYVEGYPVGSAHPDAVADLTLAEKQIQLYAEVDAIPKGLMQRLRRANHPAAEDLAAAALSPDVAPDLTAG